MKSIAPVLVVAALALSQPACYGSYAASSKLHTWNGHATGNKVANSAIHLGLWVIPVYPLAIAVDFLLLNNIEFLTGSPVL